MMLTKSERKLLIDVAERGLLFIDDMSMDYWLRRWIKKLVDEGYVTKERKPGAFGAFGHWLRITDEGLKVLNG